MRQIGHSSSWTQNQGSGNGDHDDQLMADALGGRADRVPAPGLRAGQGSTPARTTEGPVHIDAALKLAHVIRDGDFVDLPNRRVKKVRVPGALTQRKVEHVADGELDLAILNLVKSGGTVGQDEERAGAGPVSWHGGTFQVQARRLSLVDVAGASHVRPSASLCVRWRPCPSRPAGPASTADS